MIDQLAAVASVFSSVSVISKIEWYDIIKRYKKWQSRQLGKRQKDFCKKIENFETTKKIPGFDIFWLSQWLKSPLRDTAVKGDEECSYQMVRYIENFSGHYSVTLYHKKTGSYMESHSTSFGRTKRHPAFGCGWGFWSGRINGHEISKGINLIGKIDIRYNDYLNIVDVAIHSIKHQDCFEIYPIKWIGIQVDNDGTFVRCLEKDYWLKGNFYGTYAEETSGVFGLGNFVGAWSAKRSKEITESGVVFSSDPKEIKNYHFPLSL